VETQLIAAMSSQLPSFQYYYMGFYIHQCSKMRYKGQYTPSEILCPITLQWTSLDDRVKRILNQHKYARLCADPAVPEAFATEPAFNLKQELIDHCLFVYQRIPLSGKIVGTVMSLGQEFENKLRQFAWLITPALAMRFIYLLAENDINLPCN
jgi:hypothetical protein